MPDVWESGNGNRWPSTGLGSILVRGNKLSPEYECTLFAEQEREVLSENRKLEDYVLGEQLLSCLQLMD